MDGDIFLYRAACVGQKEISWDDDDAPSVHLDMDAAVSTLEEKIEDTLRNADAHKAVFALSCPTRRYWRHDLLPTYKATRKYREPPQLRGALREYLESKYECIARPGLEADDVCGILGTWAPFRARAKSGTVVIVSSDKDLTQIPGFHIQPGKRDTIFEVTRESGEKFHYTQTLTGDPCDNYDGCPGIGPVRAEKILGDLKGAAAWAAICDAYIKKGKTPADALVQARVARILRSSDWDFERKCPKLWKPPK